MHELVYRLDSERPVYRVDILDPPNDFHRKTRLSDGALIEDYFLVDTKASLISPSLMQIFRRHRAYFEGWSRENDCSLVSIVDGAVACYYLDFHPAEAYNLSPAADPALLPLSSSLMVKMSMDHEPMGIWYWCQKPGAFMETLAGLRNYLGERNQAACYENLVAILDVNHSRKFIFHRKNDGAYWAYVGVGGE